MTAEWQRAWVTRCALSRICGVCGEPLGRPIAFVGSQEEVDRNAFHAPPMHTACAKDLTREEGADREVRVVLTSGFEFVRPKREDLDRDPTFQPNSLLSPT
jgi:hypothetical protein